MKKNKSVDDYIAKQPSQQKKICERLRQLIDDTLPGINERFWVGVPWYEDMFYIASLKDHVNLGAAIVDLTEKERRLFEGKGKMMRHIKVFDAGDIDEKKIVELIKMVAKRHVGMTG